MSSRRLLLLSNSRLHGQEWCEWCTDYIKSFLRKCNVSNILFIPYAVADYDGYLKTVRSGLQKSGLNVESIHEKPDPIDAINACEGLFIGGGNTFLLLKTLYEKKLIEPIQQCILTKNVPYIGISAGTNVATRTINTTNDMPICFPPTFDALHLVPFNINPHYIDADPSSKHMGETRETRIKEYFEQPTCSSVLGLREGSGLLVEGMKATLIGLTPAIVFQKGKDPVCYEQGSDLSFLLNEKCT